MKIEESVFQDMKKTRIVEFTSRYKYKEHDQMLFIITTKGMPIIVAEYEVVGMEQLPIGKIVKLEPIYIAPRFGGLKLNDIVKLQVSKYIDYDKDHSRIKQKDFSFLAKKLVS